MFACLFCYVYLTTDHYNKPASFPIVLAKKLIHSENVVDSLTGHNFRHLENLPVFLKTSQRIF